MKKIISLSLALVLSFSLVACQAQEKQETSVETTTEGETTAEAETTAEGETTTEAEESTAEEEHKEPLVVEFMSLKDNIVLANNTEEQKIVTLEAGNQSSYMLGFRYSYEPESVPELTDPFKVDAVDMLGIQVGYPLNTELVDEVLQKVDTAVVVDARSEEEFATGHIANAKNVPADKVSALSEAEDADEQIATLLQPTLEGFTPDTVVLVIGSDEVANANIANVLYTQGKIKATLNAGLLSNYTGELVTE